MNEQVFSEGNYLFWEGDTSTALYYIKEGHIKIKKTTPDGKELNLYTYHAGDLLGNVDLNPPVKHTYSAEVIENSRIGIILKRDLELLLIQSSELSVDVMKWMGTHHSITQTKLRDLLLYGKQGALSSTLIRLGNTYGRPFGRYTLINKKITHTELSNMIGATRESVNRLIADLRKQDTIAIHEGMIVIKSLEDLQYNCNCEHCPITVCRI